MAKNALPVARCKITVLECTVNQHLVDEYLDVDIDFGKNFGVCPVFTDGQEFIVEQPFVAPEGFCNMAWADLRGELIAIASGADYFWFRHKGTYIAGCTDWLRPVYFKIERLD